MKRGRSDRSGLERICAQAQIGAGVESRAMPIFRDGDGLRATPLVFVSHCGTVCTLQA